MSMYTWRSFRDTPNVRELENTREFTSYAIQSQAPWQQARRRSAKGQGAKQVDRRGKGN